jgi:hypothetical protein
VELNWKKSSRSGPWTDNCVEVAFTKSTHSSTDGSCVEVANDVACDKILVRDSKDPSGPVLTFTPPEWEAFLAGTKDGEFDIK